MAIPKRQVYLSKRKVNYSKRQIFSIMIYSPKFKKIAIVLIIGTIITGVVLRLVLAPHNIYIKTIFMDLFIIGLALYAFSKDKIEDERILEIRYRSFAFAFIFLIVYGLLISVFNLFIGDFQLNSQELIMASLVAFIVCFTLLKRSDNNESVD